MKTRRRQPEGTTFRRGAAIVEGTLVLGVFLVVLLGSLDLALAVLRNNTLRESARQLARMAIVRGKESAGAFTPWGPDKLEGTAIEQKAYTIPVRDRLVAADPAAVRVQLEWPDGGNDEGDRVQVTVSSSYRPILTSVFGSYSILMSATSTMTIEH